jgi:hypothetical protein
MTIAPSLALGALLVAFAATPAQSQAIGIRAAAAARLPKNAIANAIQEASRRFHVPASWLRAVMRAESAGDANSVSEKGAIGLMQVMPETYVELRAKHGFGPDPFEPRDNVLAGAAYLADMFSRYGEGGFLAAYNAGPGRYEEHLFRGRPLPAETTDYVARLAPILGLANAPTTQIHAPSDAPHAPIFVALSTPKAASDPTPDGAPKGSRTVEKAIPHPLFPASSGDTIFARETHSDVASKASSGAAAIRTNGLFIARGAPESAQ